MEMKGVKIISVCDLVSYGVPHTGSSSPIISRQNPSSLHCCPSNSNPKPKELTPLEYPAILIGTLRLPTLTLKCPQGNCLEFLDETSCICCDILALDLRIIGKKIHVLTWNFIPSKHLNGGFLEIVKWEGPDLSEGCIQRSSLLIDSFPLISASVVSNFGSSKSYQIHGILESVSPVSVVSCSVNHSTSSNLMELRGFLVRIMTCECTLCDSKESVTVLYGVPDCHSFTKPVFVYFCESAWCWHPVIIKIIGNLVTISGLGKKLIFMGKQDSDLMFVTVENSVIYLPRLWKKWVSFSTHAIKRNGDCGSYTGAIRNVYMEGMIVELDKEVWLLLTDELLMPPHGLRVGAIITVRNAHFVKPKFSWAKFLVLGACFKTSMTIESFSPLETGCLVVSKSESQLGKFIGSLEFCTRLWVLLLVLCFHKKFSGTLSGKMILGSKRKKGLAQMFASSRLPSSVFQTRHGVFMEFKMHESCGCNNEPYHVNLKLVLPISSFLHHCAAIWKNTVLESDTVQPSSCQKRPYLPSLRKTYRSGDLGIVLLGILKISSSSGRLQFVDKTGSIDAIIPDFPSKWNFSNLIEVTDYSLIVEGIPESVDVQLLSNESLSCRSIFNCFRLKKGNLKIFVHFQLFSAMCRNLLFYPPVHFEEKVNEIENGTFHLIHITHKFPPQLKLKGESMISRSPSVFAEAVVLPWYLFLAGHDGSEGPNKVSGDCTLGSNIEHAPSKRHRTDCTDSSVNQGLMGNLCGTSSDSLTSSFRQTHGDQHHLSMSMSMSFPHKFPCLASIRGVNNSIFSSSGLLYRTKAIAKIIDAYKESADRVLLEFTSESELKYQLLQIDGFYLMKHHNGDPLCDIEMIQKADDRIGAKVHVSSGTYLQSISFSPEVVSTDKLLHDPSSSQCNNEAFPRDQALSIACDSSVPDVHLHVSSVFTSLLGINTKELKKGLKVSDVSLAENSSLSSDIESMMITCSLPSDLPGSNCLLPEGNLTSLCGDVICVHNFDQGSADACSTCEDFGDLPHFGLALRTNICIHVSVDHQTVRIVGSLSQHQIHTGFGPGTNATFHRILELRGTKALMLTPVSVILINSIRIDNQSYCKKCSDFGFSDMGNAASTKMATSSGLISELMLCSNGNLKHFHCRVVASQFLVLEKRNQTMSNMHSWPLGIDIPIACFILDDGSSACRCWANAETAATLLRLHEHSPTTSLSNIDHLQRILEKHDRITVKNTRSIYDSFHQDFAVSINSGEAFSGSNEDLYLLISIVFNACINTSWTVVAEVMDSKAVHSLKEQFGHMDMPMPPMKSIWAREAYYVDQLNEARDRIQKLVNRPESLKLGMKLAEHDERKKMLENTSLNACNASLLIVEDYVFL